MSGALSRQIHILSGDGIRYVLLKFISTTCSYVYNTQTSAFIYTIFMQSFFYPWKWIIVVLFEKVCSRYSIIEYCVAWYTIHNAAISFYFLSYHISMVNVVEILLSISREIFIARYLDSDDGMQPECNGISRELRIGFREFFFRRPVTRHCVIRYFYSG